MRKLHFEKISMYDRSAEPATVSIPFAQGTLTEADRLRVKDADAELPAQRRALSSWPDGSVKWLLVHLEPDLPGNAGKELAFEIADCPVPSPPRSHAVTVQERPDGVVVDTGRLRFLVPNSGFLPVSEIELNGKRLWEDEPLRGFCMQCGGRELASVEARVEIEIEEAGPLRAVILVRGRHLDRDGSPFIDFRGRVTAYAGKSYVEVEYQFLHCEDEGELELRELRLDVKPSGESTAKLALGEGYPLLLRHPLGKGAGTVCDELVYTQDVSATVIEASRVTPIGGVEGQNLLPLAEATDGFAAREYLTCRYGNSVWYKDSKSWFFSFGDFGDPHLFDLETDLTCQHNIADQAPDRVKLARERILADAGGKVPIYRRRDGTDALGRPVFEEQKG